MSLCNYIELLPEDLISKIYMFIHQSNFTSTLRSLISFEREKLHNVSNLQYRYINEYNWKCLHDDITNFENKLFDLLKLNIYENFLKNTNVPKVIILKTLGENYEEVLKKSILENKTLPLSLRNYLLYNKVSTFYHGIYHIKASDSKHELKVFPGGQYYWEWLYEDNIEQAELKDLSKHLWKFLDWDLDINNLGRFETIEERFDYLKKTKKL